MVREWRKEGVFCSIRITEETVNPKTQTRRKIYLRWFLCLSLFLLRAIFRIKPIMCGKGFVTSLRINLDCRMPCSIVECHARVRTNSQVCFALLLKQFLGESFVNMSCSSVFYAVQDWWVYLKIDLWTYTDLSWWWIFVQLRICGNNDSGRYCRATLQMLKTLIYFKTFQRSVLSLCNLY